MTIPAAIAILAFTVILGLGLVAAMCAAAEEMVDHERK